jgi:streptogramin lyase
MPNADTAGRRLLRASTVAMLMLGLGVAQAGAEAGPPTIEATLPTAAYGLATGFDSIWAMEGTDLLRIDPRDNSIIRIPVPESKSGIRRIAIGEGAVWLPDGRSGFVFKVDPATNTVMQAIPAGLVDAGDGTIGVGAGSIWVMTVGGGKAWVARYSAATGAEEARIPLKPAGMSIVFDFGSAWVTGTYKNVVYRIDAATNTLTAEIKTPANPRQIASGEGAIWVQSIDGGGFIHRIDPATNSVMASIPTDTTLDAFGSVGVGGGYVWGMYHQGTLLQIDPASNAVVSRYDDKMLAGVTVTYAAGSVWVSGYGSSIYRVAPPKP